MNTLVVGITKRDYLSRVIIETHVVATEKTKAEFFAELEARANALRPPDRFVIPVHINIDGFRVSSLELLMYDIQMNTFRFAPEQVRVWDINEYVSIIEYNKNNNNSYS